ncbi:hypothetical protein [Cardiobacterium valvarum]|nr:hypothetical protein [Cardiobacterium valvarum]
MPTQLESRPITQPLRQISAVPGRSSPRLRAVAAEHLQGDGADEGDEEELQVVGGNAGGDKGAKQAATDAE